MQQKYIQVNEFHNPWTILSEKLIYDNPWIQVNEYEVLNPGGGKGIYGKVHFKNIAIAILPLDHLLNIYLVGQFRFSINQYSWEIPEGGGLTGIDPLDCAKKELLEETGLVANSWSKLMEIHISNSVTDETGIVYIARNLEQHTATPEETEQLAIQKVPFEKAYQMVEDGIITDSISVASILKVKLMLADGRISS